LSSIATDPNNGSTQCQLFAQFFDDASQVLRSVAGISWIPLQKTYFLYRRLPGVGNDPHVRQALRQCPLRLFGNTGGKLMADNEEKILPVIRLLLVAFFGLLFVIALQLFLLVSGANAGIVEAARNLTTLILKSLV
jgi:hypothetical protein